MVLLLKSLFGGGGALLFIIISMKYVKNSFLAKSRADNLRTDKNIFTLSLVLQFHTGDLTVSFCDFFCGVHLPLEYDYMCSGTDFTQENKRISLGGKLGLLFASAPHCRSGNKFLKTFSL